MSGQKEDRQTPIKIEWQSVELQGVTYDKAALLFRVPLEGRAQEAVVQLDTGHFESSAHVGSDFQSDTLQLTLGRRTFDIPATKDLSEGLPRVLLGVDVLQQIRVRIDVTSDLIVFNDDIPIDKFSFIGGEKDSKGRLIFPLSVNGNFMGMVLVDSGAALFEVTSTLELSKSILAKNAIPVRKLVLPPYSHPDGNKELVFSIYSVDQLVQMGPVSHQSFELSVHNSKNPLLDFAQDTPPTFGVVGLQFFKTFDSIVLDYPDNRLGVR